MSVDWQNAKVADGPSVARWFEQRPHLLSRHPSLERRLTDWRKGARPAFWTVDRYMALCEYHVSDLPTEVWLEGSWRQRNPNAVYPGKKKTVFYIKPCAHCGEPIPRTSGKKAYAQRRYCSFQCSREARYG